MMSKTMLESESISAYQADGTPSADWLLAQLDVLRERSLHQDNTVTFIERERILGRICREELPALPGDEHTAHAFCCLLDDLSTPIQQADVILGRMIEGRPDVSAEELESILAQPSGHRDRLLNWVLGSPGHFTPDFGRLVREGLAGIVAGSEVVAARLGDDDSRRFARDARRCAEAIRRFAARYADAADAQAATTDDHAWRATLRAAARSLRRVPHEPARDLREALQSVWLLHFIIQCCIGARDVGFGRADQYLAEFVDDPATPEQVALLAHFLQKTNENIGTQGAHYRSKPVPSWGSKQYLFLGGRDDAGQECWNHASDAILEAAALVRLTQPTLQVRCDHRYRQDRLAHAMAVANATQGNVNFINDDSVVASFVAAGIPRAEALDYTGVGCSRIDLGQSAIANEHFLCPIHWLLWLLDGCPDQLRTGYGWSGYDCDGDAVAVAIAAKFRPSVENPDQYAEAGVSRIIDDFRRLATVIFTELLPGYDTYVEPLYQHHRPLVPGPHFHPESMVLGECAVRCRNYCEGGMPRRLETLWISGIATMADSLTTVQRLVCVERRMTLHELLAICRSNFAGHARLRQEILHAIPKFGNDEPEADEVAAALGNAFCDALGVARPAGRHHYLLGFYSLINYLGFGRGVMATPDGRLDGEPLSENQSPTQGADLHGPTALLNSIARLPFHRAGTGGLNVTFSRTVDPDRMVSLLRGYFRQGGVHLGLTFADRATLRDAQAHPDRHRTLFIRHYGFTEYFVGLQPDEQEDLIARTRLD